MSDKQQETDTRRRAFLKGSVAAGTGAAVVAAAPAVAAVAPEVEADKPEPLDDRYKLSAHILKYYQTAAS